MGGCGWLCVGAGGYVCVGGWMEVGVGGCGCAWVFVGTFKCTHMCTCVHMCARVGAYMCVCTVRVRVGEGGGEFVLVVGCICVDGWWLRRGLSSLYLQRLLRSHDIQTSSQAFHQHANRNQILFKPGGVLIGSRTPHF